jgi:hypothetical protein
MAEQQDVSIISWPESQATLGHRFDTPADVRVTSDGGFGVDMDMRLSAKEAVPVCIKVCEPICLRSNYTVAIDIFDRPVASITLSGQTVILNCRDDEPPR